MCGAINVTKKGMCRTYAKGCAGHMERRRRINDHITAVTGTRGAKSIPGNSCCKWRIGPTGGVGTNNIIIGGNALCEGLPERSKSGQGTILGVWVGYNNERKCKQETRGASLRKPVQK